MHCLPIQEARLIRRYQEQTLTAGIVVKSCHTALQTFSCLFYQLSACASPLACGPLAPATCCFLKRIANNLFKYFTVCYARPGLIFWGVSFWGQRAIRQHNGFYNTSHNVLPQCFSYSSSPDDFLSLDREIFPCPSPAT